MTKNILNGIGIAVIAALLCVTCSNNGLETSPNNNGDAARFLDRINCSANPSSVGCPEYCPPTQPGCPGYVDPDPCAANPSAPGCRPGSTEFTISFSANGGSVSPASGTTTNGMLATLPTPTRPDYAFNGWYTAASGGTRVTTAHVFTANTTIYAQWTAVGTSNPCAGLTTATPGSACCVDQPAFNGCTSNPPTNPCAGLTTATPGSACCVDQPSFNGCTSNPPTNPCAGLTIATPGSACCVDQPAFNGCTSNPPTNPCAGLTIATPGSVCCVDQPTFNGCTSNPPTNPCAGLSVATPGSPCCAFNPSFAGCTSTPTAKYTVSFDADGGSGTITAQTVNAGSSITLPNGSELTRNGYRFIGWTNYNGTTTYAAGSLYTPNGNVTLYALWEAVSTPNTYTLTTKVNPSGSGNITRDPNQTTFTSGTAVYLTAAAVSGYRFVRWSGDATGTTSPINVTMNANKTIYAEFEQTPVATCPELIKDTKFMNVKRLNWTDGVNDRYTRYNSDGWATDYWAHEDTKAAFGVSGVEMTVDVTYVNNLQPDYQVNLHYFPISLVYGKTYTISFEALTTSSGGKYIKVQSQDPGIDGVEWLQYGEGEFYLTTIFTKYSFDVTMSSPSNTLTDLQFNFGSSTGVVKIRNVSVKETPCQ